MAQNYKVKVHFKTIIKQNEDVSKFDISAEGTLVKSSNLDRIYFQSSIEGLQYQIEVSIYESKLIKIKQSKPNQSTLEFDAAKKTLANYVTDYGNLDLQIKTSKLVFRPGTLVIEYYVENGPTDDSFYSIELNYKEIN